MTVKPMKLLDQAWMIFETSPMKPVVPQDLNSVQSKMGSNQAIGNPCQLSARGSRRSESTFWVSGE